MVAAPSGTMAKSSTSPAKVSVSRCLLGTSHLEVAVEGNLECQTVGGGLSLHDRRSNADAVVPPSAELGIEAVAVAVVRVTEIGFVEIFGEDCR